MFYHGVSLNRRIPQNHPLRKIDQLVDFNFIRSKVADLYGTVGNKSVDPTVILRLIFLMYYENVNSERALMSQLPLRLDWLWFCGYDIGPAGKRLEIKHYNRNENAVTYIADRKVCRQCQHFKKCVASKKAGRQVQRNINKEYIDWADNCLTGHERKRLMTRRKYKAEGSFADAANNHGFKRMRFRGIEKAKIQNLMIASIQNLRKLMRYAGNKPAAQGCNRVLSSIFDVNLSHLSRLFDVEQIVNQFKSEYSFFKERLPKKRQFIILFKRVACKSY